MNNSKTQFKKGFTPWNKGIKTGFSPRKGIVLTQETKDKISLSKKGSESPMKGKKHKQETIEKIRKANRGINIGENNHNWKGGFSLVDKSIRGMSEYFNWRTEVFKRDNHTCQVCNFKGYVTAHHIKSFSKIIKEFKIKTREQARKCKDLWNIKNGITLCEECHRLTDNYKGRAITKKTL